MRKEKIDSYRQKDYAAKVFSKGFQSDNASQRHWEEKMLAVYLRDNCGMKPAERKEFMERFCKEHIPNYHFRLHYAELESALRYANKKDNSLIQVDEIPVYSEEVRKIREAGSTEEERRLMFCILIMKKLDKRCFEQRRQGEEYWMAYFTADSKKMSALKKVSGCKGDITKNYFYKWREEGKVQVTYTGFRLSFLDGIVEEGEIVEKIKFYDVIGIYWDAIEHPDKVKRCVECGKPFHKQSRRIYCEECGEKEGRKILPIPNTKQLECANCGRSFFVSSKVRWMKYCPSCANAVRRKEKAQLENKENTVLQNEK